MRVPRNPVRYSLCGHLQLSFDGRITGKFRRSILRASSSYPARIVYLTKSMGRPREAGGRLPTDYQQG